MVSLPRYDSLLTGYISFEFEYQLHRTFCSQCVFILYSIYGLDPKKYLEVKIRLVILLNYQFV